MAGTIGIKIANGDFYPILEENSSVKKRLVLTTVHDGQESVQIDLFRSLSKSMLDAQYIGSLVVEKIHPRPKGEPSIEMVISAGEDGTITADAHLLDRGIGGENHQLNVSLKTMDSTDPEDNFPDFDLEKNNAQTPTGLYDLPEAESGQKQKFPWLIMILSALLIAVVIALLWFFFFGEKEEPPPAFNAISEPAPRPPAPAAPEPAAPEPVVEVIVEPPVVVVIEPPRGEPEVIVVEEVRVIQAPAAPPERPQVVQRQRPPAPVSSYRVPTVIPRNGVAYQIRWGDTLWDISAAFYRNPWLYPRIARYNNISNPDLIIAGRTIRIPPQN